MTEIIQEIIQEIIPEIIQEQINLPIKKTRKPRTKKITKVIPEVIPDVMQEAIPKKTRKPRTKTDKVKLNETDIEQIIEENIKNKTKKMLPIQKAPVPKNFKKPKEKQTAIDSKQFKLLYSDNGLVNFYKSKINKDLLVSIVKQKTSISLRLLDWLVTNYSKKYNIHYKLNENENEYILSSHNFNLWMDYKNQLKSYNKKNFDPFCRNLRIFFNTKNYTVMPIPDENDYDTFNNKDDGILTTVGQLNFFKWGITNRVIDYASDNIDIIESDMLSFADKRGKKNNQDNNKKNRKNKTTPSIGDSDDSDTSDTIINFENKLDYGLKNYSNSSGGVKSQKIKVIIQFQ